MVASLANSRGTRLELHVVAKACLHHAFLLETTSTNLLSPRNIVNAREDEDTVGTAVTTGSNLDAGD